jgi:CheY-like chemotaxis protein
MTHKVLIVDDSLAQARQLSSLVTESGACEVAGVAHTGADGIKLFEQLKPELVLLDVVMPVLDGLSCLRAIRALDAKVPVVLISAMGAVTRTIEEAEKLGVQEIIAKPYDPDAVRAVLKKIFAEG